MKLFHGSNQEVTEPRLIRATRGLDFGKGFYLTTSEEQANKFSDVVLRRRKSGIATVSIYEFDMATAKKSLSVCKFAKADRKWLKFVSENRLGIYSGELFDVVIGAVANDIVMPTMQAYLGGFLTEEATLLTLKTSRLEDQICLKSEKALSLIQFVTSYYRRGG